LQLLQCPDHVGRGIDQRAVEIEENGFDIAVGWQTQVITWFQVGENA
jgi:hypothetical protein